MITEVLSKYHPFWKSIEKIEASLPKRKKLKQNCKKSSATANDIGENYSKSSLKLTKAGIKAIKNLHLESVYEKHKQREQTERLKLNKHKRSFQKVSFTKISV